MNQKNELLLFQKIIIEDAIIAELILDQSYAQKLYSSLCNKIFCINENKFIGQLSLKNSAQLVSTLRNIHVNMGHEMETYQNYYMTGNEGIVFPEIRDQLERLGYTFQYFDE